MSERRKSRGTKTNKATPSTTVKLMTTAPVPASIDPAYDLGSEDAATTSSFGPWGVPSGAGVKLNSLGLPEEAPKTRELEGITDRLHRALSDIATLYNDDENEMNKIDDDIDNERRQYLSRLEALNDRFSSIEHDRAELIHSLGDMDIDDDLVQGIADAENGHEMPNVLSSLRKRMASEQMGFQKLRDLNVQMLQMKNQGKAGALNTEVNVQSKVIDKFKQMFKARKTKVVDRTFGSHWKHAAGEIVGLLGKIRLEGKTDIDMLRKTLENTEQLISKQVTALARMEERVYDKQEEINKCQLDFSVLESDNMLLKSEVNQYRNRVVELKRKIKQLEASQKEAAKHAADEGEKAPAPQPRRLVTEIPVEPSSAAAGPTKDFRGKRTFKKGPKGAVGPDVITDVKQQNEQLIDKVTSLEMKVIEKETKNMRMEHDVSELLENIRATSPEAMRHLRRSVDLTRYLPGDDDGDDEYDDDPAREVAISLGDRTDNVTPIGGRRSTPQTRIASISPRRRAAKPRTPAQILGDIQSSKDNIDGGHTALAEEGAPSLADFNRERGQKTRLASELESVKKELTRAKRELVSLQFGGSRGYAVAGHRSVAEKATEQEREKEDKTTDKEKSAMSNGAKPADSLDVGRARSCRRSSVQPPNVAKLLAKVAPSAGNKPGDEKSLYEQLKSQGLHKASPRRNVRVIRETVGRKVVSTAAAGHQHQHGILSEVAEEDEGGEGAVVGGAATREGTLDDEGNLVSFEEFVLVDQGMQTDPLLDPLGAWSNMTSLSGKHGKRSASPRRVSPGKGSVPLPPPPEEWTQYDPTPIKGPHGPSPDKRRSAQRAGDGSRPGSAADGLFFVERELSRIISGIQGFTAYVCQLLAREVSDIAESNENIRRQMSARSLQRIERMAGTGSELAGEREEERDAKSLATTAPIRRGRFELIRKDHPASSFLKRQAFANYTAGKRSVMAGSTTLPEARRTLADSNMALPFQLANECFVRADAEAQRRLVAELTSSGKVMTSGERWNLEVELIGKYAIDVLRGTCDFFRHTVDQQTREHHILTEGLKMKEEIECALRGGKTDGDVPLKLKRSVSHSSFLEPNHGIFTSGRGLLHVTPTIPPPSKSLSSIQSSHRYLPSLMIARRLQKPVNRDEMVIPRTVLPRGGMVRLEAVGSPRQDNTQADKTIAGAGNKKAYAYRPAPQSYRGLLAKQTAGRRRNGNARGEGGKDATTFKHLLLQLDTDNTTSQNTPPTGIGRRREAGKAMASDPEAEDLADAISGERGVTSIVKAAKQQLNSDNVDRRKIMSIFSS